MTVPNLIFGSKGEGAHVDLERLYESRLLIQGVSGSGKSTMIRSLLEQTHGKVPQLVVDFDGDFVTLREKFDYVLVGPGGDVPISIKTAKITMRRLAELDGSAIFDISEMKFDDRREWVKLACEELVHLPRKHWSTRLFILDEAHIFAPERSSGDSVATGAVIDVITLGRKRGIVTVCATQRLSKLHKDAAAELNNKLIGYTDDVDLQRAGDQLGMTKEQRGGLKLLDTHTFYAYGPAISRAPVLVHTLMPQTSPPPRGQARPEAAPAPAAVRKMLAQLVDLPKEAEEEAKTVADLQRKNADLERRIRQAEKSGLTKEVVKTVVDQAAIDRAVTRAVASERDRVRRWRSDLGKLTARLDEAAGRVQATRSGLVIIAEEMGQNVATPAPPASDRPGGIRPAAVAPKRVVERPRADEQPSRTYTDANSYVSLGKGERQTLIAIAQYPDGVEREQLTVLTGYKKTSRDGFIRRLAAADLVKVGDSGIVATDAGVAALGSDFEPLPKGEQLQEYWLNRLPEGERKILDILIRQYPDLVDRESLSEDIGYKKTSRDVFLRRLAARNLTESKKTGVRASPTLFDEALV